MVKDLKTLAEFEEEIKKSNLVVVDFTASWCPPCQQIKPKYHALAKEAEHANVSFCQVDVDANGEASEKAGIECMPTFQFWKNGVKLDTMKGADFDGLVKQVKAHKGDEEVYNAQKEHMIEAVEEKSVDGLPRYVYIPRGRRNLQRLMYKMNSTEKEGFEKLLKDIQPIMCSENNNQIFGISGSNQLLFNLESKEMVKEFGELKHVFGDFLVLGHKIKNSQIKTFMQFSDFTDTHGDEELRLNGQKELTDEMLQSQIIFGKYQGEDQGWGNEKGTMLFHVNDTVLHCQRPIDRYNLGKEFQIYLEDAQARKGDQISNRHHANGFGGHALRCSEISIFTLPYLFTEMKEVDYEVGVIGYEGECHASLDNYELSKYTKKVEMPEDEVTRFESDIAGINSDAIENDAVFKIECQLNNYSLAFNGDEAWTTAVPILVKNNGEVFRAIKNNNGTFCLSPPNGYGGYGNDGTLYLGIDGPTSEHDLKSIKLMNCENVEENKNVQWYFKGDNLINVVGGYLTITCGQMFSENIAFCSSEKEGNLQKWKFIE